MKCNERQAEGEAEKARLFDVLADRLASNDWTMLPDGFATAVIRINRTGERVHGATLAEAVKAAMESEER